MPDNYQSVINIYINDDLQETTNNQWTINIEGYPNIEYDVHEFIFILTCYPIVLLQFLWQQGIH